MKVSFTGYFWSGYHIDCELQQLPAVGELIKPWEYEDRHTPSAALSDSEKTYLVAKVIKDFECSCCGKRCLEEKSSALPVWIVYCERPEKIENLREYYSTF